MITINEKYLIKRNILLFNRLYNKIMLDGKVREGIQAVADESEYSYGTVRHVYYYKKYAFSPWNIFDEKTGKIVGTRTIEEIVDEAKRILKEDAELEKQSA